MNLGKRASKAVAAMRKQFNSEQFGKTTAEITSWLQSPWLQVLAVAVLQRLLPSSTWSELYQSAKCVLVARLLAYSASLPDWAQAMLTQLQQLASTSQICATRLNLIEWRQRLKFASQWHECTV